MSISLEYIRKAAGSPNPAAYSLIIPIAPYSMSGLNNVKYTNSSGVLTTIASSAGNQFTLSSLKGGNILSVCGYGDNGPNRNNVTGIVDDGVSLFIVYPTFNGIIRIIKSNASQSLYTNSLLFNQPYDIVFNPSTQIFYVTNRGNNNILKITWSNTSPSVSIYSSHSSLTGLSGMTYDYNNGNLYVVSATNNAIIRISDTNPAVINTIITDSNNIIANYTYGITNYANIRLYVSSGDRIIHYTDSGPSWSLTNAVSYGLLAGVGNLVLNKLGTILYVANQINIVQITLLSDGKLFDFPNGLFATASILTSYTRDGTTFDSVYAITRHLYLSDIFYIGQQSTIQYIIYLLTLIPN